MDEELERRKKIFYEYFADGVFKFSSDQILNVSTAFLAEKSTVFQKLFMDSSPDRVVEIKDYDCNTFKYFLDCLMDFQDYSVADTLVLFPMAWKYETKKFIKKCLDILEPKELDENVCLTLNLALCCNCEELKESVINFLKSEKLIYRIFHEAKFYAFLEPESVRELLRHIEVDSYIIRIIFDWGNGYLSKNNKPVDFRSFFLENRITELIPVSGFETSQALFDFNNSELGKGFYLNNVQDYFTLYGDSVDIRKCSWFDIKAGEILTEKLIVKNFALLQHYNVSVKVYRSPIIFYEHSKKENMVNYNYELKMTYPNELEATTEEYERAEGTGTVYRKRMRAAWTTSNNRSCMSNLKFEIKCTFKYDCRILKRSPKKYDVIEPNPENLYFTDCIELELVKK